MKKAIFVDRDGTIIVEPEDEQVDSLEKLEFIPETISSLRSLTGLDYELVMASNQDGLGTVSFPMENFLPVQEKMLKTLKGEGVEFDDILIDSTLSNDNAETRKPGTGMFRHYLDGSYDLAKCYVIGDRSTDIRLAKNLGANGILLSETEKGKKMLEETGLTESCVLLSQSWSEIADYIRRGCRSAVVERVTSETEVLVKIDLDKRGKFDEIISTGLLFFDHMLSQLVRHGGMSLLIKAKGDLQVDEHHTIEDTGIALGQAVEKALGEKAGIARYGFVLPMDDCRAMVLIDFGGRIDFEWDVEFKREFIGDVPTEMFRHFFMSFCCAAKCNLHISAQGDNNHHKAESVFKAFARALRMAAAHIPFEYEIPSSKGVL